MIRAAEQDRPDVARRRRMWRKFQPLMDVSRLVFLDETGAKTNMARTRGRSRRGARLVAEVPFGHWKSLTFVGAIRTTGRVAPPVVHGAMNGPTFRAYLEQQLGPSLSPGDVVVRDNLPGHRLKCVRQILARFGASVWYLPTYSPDLNPIELAFGKLKRLLRTAAERSVAGLEHQFGHLLDRFGGEESANYIKACGYRYE